ncbi:MAG: hypothetical protein IIU04_05365, partial [Bacteroidales bacterium]|nr:hypothetical protein [Bacteroidales bacterium]
MHLRTELLLDDGRQPPQFGRFPHSVQNASYEQKDPLLIFKLESAKVWDEMINEMYNRICSILTRSGIP